MATKETADHSEEAQVPLIKQFSKPAGQQIFSVHKNSFSPVALLLSLLSAQVLPKLRSLGRGKFAPKNPNVRSE